MTARGYLLLVSPAVGSVSANVHTNLMEGGMKIDRKVATGSFCLEALVVVLGLLAVVGCKQSNIIAQGEQEAAAEGCLAGAELLAEELSENRDMEKVRDALAETLLDCLADTSPADVREVLEHEEGPVVLAGLSSGRLTGLLDELTTFDPLGDDDGPTPRMGYSVCLNTLPGADSVELVGVELDSSGGRCMWRGRIPESTIMEQLDGEKEADLALDLRVSYGGQEVAWYQTHQVRAPLLFTGPSYAPGSAMENPGFFSFTWDTPVDARVSFRTSVAPGAYGSGRSGSEEVGVLTPSTELSSIPTSDIYRVKTMTHEVVARFAGLRNRSYTVRSAAQSFCSHRGADCDLDYRRLKTNPEGYRGRRVHYRGRIVQVLVEGDTTFMLVDVAGYNNGNIALLYHGSQPEFVERQYVHVYGRVVGTYSYESQAGWNISIPQIYPFLITDGNYRRYECPFE